MADRQAVHKSGPLKQQNKAHKNGKHRTKGQIAALFKGRVSFKTHTRNSRKEARKADRKNKMKQLRANKRHETFMAKRNVGVEGTPPHLVVVLCMSESVDQEAVHSLLCGASRTEEEDPAIPFSSLTTLCHPILKHRFTLLFPKTSDLYALLDVVKIADTLLLVYGAGEKEGEREALALHCCYSQGLPATCHVIQGLEKLGTKERNSAKKATQKTIETRFHGERLHILDSLQDGGSVLRFISNQKRRAVVCRDMHPHLLAESTQFIPSKENEEVGTLEVSGYVRGRPLSVNGLLHIPGLGDFQMTQITAPPDPHPVKARLHRPPAAVMDTGEEREGMTEEIKVVAVADPAKQESLDREVELDPMEGDQTWPTEEELAEASRLQQPLRPSEARRVPRGTSDYQAAWIVADSEDEVTTHSLLGFV
jgi:pre-rRNA-processing protein TSR1